MGEVLVRKGTLSEGKIESLTVGFHGLPERTIDRDTAIAWMRDGHSLIPVRAGERLTALQLVDIEDGGPAIRTDNQAVAEDELPAL